MPGNTSEEANGILALNPNFVVRPTDVTQYLLPGDKKRMGLMEDDRPQQSRKNQYQINEDESSSSSSIDDALKRRLAKMRGSNTGVVNESREPVKRGISNNTRRRIRDILNRE